MVDLVVRMTLSIILHCLLLTTSGSCFVSRYLRGTQICGPTDNIFLETKITIDDNIHMAVLTPEQDRPDFTETSEDVYGRLRGDHLPGLRR